MDCIFCKIASGQAQAVKIWEDEEFFAILDIFPNTKGMTLVIPKKHYDSYVVDMQDDVYMCFMAAAKKVSRMLEKGLKVKRVALVAEGLGVNHAHIKLYPIHGLDKKFEEVWAKNTIYFENYQGYISTQLGPKKEQTELEKLAKEILGKK